jgi:hypothetical protein
VLAKLILYSLLTQFNLHPPYFGYSVMLCVFSLFLILVFEILVPYIFDVVCHSPYFEEENNL